MQFQGNWKKVSTDPGEDAYPDEIEFNDKGLYFGRKGPGGHNYTVWDVGRYEVLGPDRVKLSTSNDAEITYPYSCANDAVTFTTPEGRRVQYRRSAGRQ